MSFLEEVRALNSTEVDFSLFSQLASQWVHLKAKYIVVYLEMTQK